MANAKLFYGDGSSSIEGNGIRAIQISYSHSDVYIVDKTPDSFVLINRNNGIIVFPMGDGYLSDLFEYEGKLQILDVIVSDNNAKRIDATIHKNMDYAELLGTTESLTLNSEKMDAGYVRKKKIIKESKLQRIIPNLKTSSQDGDLYLENGDLYEGEFHVHIYSSISMTGKEHTEDSKELYIRRKKNNRLVKTGPIFKRGAK